MCPDHDQIRLIVARDPDQLGRGISLETRADARRPARISRAAASSASGRWSAMICLPTSMKSSALGA